MENNDIDDNLLTPSGEDEITQDECYSCSECNSNIEIQELDYNNNIISFQCSIHGFKTMSIKEYFDVMPNNTFYYS